MLRKVERLLCKETPFPLFVREYRYTAVAHLLSDHCVHPAVAAV